MVSGDGVAGIKGKGAALERREDGGREIVNHAAAANGPGVNDQSLERALEQEQGETGKHDNDKDRVRRCG